MAPKAKPAESGRERIIAHAIVDGVVIAGVVALAALGKIDGTHALEVLTVVAVAWGAHRLRGGGGGAGGAGVVVGVLGALAMPARSLFSARSAVALAFLLCAAPIFVPGCGGALEELEGAGRSVLRCVLIEGADYAKPPLRAPVDASSPDAGAVEPIPSRSI